MKQAVDFGTEQIICLLLPQLLILAKKGDVVEVRDIKGNTKSYSYKKLNRDKSFEKVSTWRNCKMNYLKYFEKIVVQVVFLAQGHHYKLFFILFNDDKNGETYWLCQLTYKYVSSLFAFVFEFFKLKRDTDRLRWQKLVAGKCKISPIQMFK